jgi:signal transduction histidine kinase
MGRLIREEEIQQLIDQTHVQFALWPVNDPAIPSAAKQASAALTTTTPTIRDGGNGSLYVYANMADIFGNPCLVLRAEIPKAISAHGDAAGRVALYSNIVGGAAIMLFLGFILRQTVSRPLLKLSRHMASVGQSDDLKSQLNLTRRDEIGQVASSFDKMVKALYESRAKVLNTARQAGMAEIAIGVLHNVGNVLNSVNTSATVLREKLINTKSANLGKAAALIQDHRQDIGEYLANDPRGKQLPDFLSHLAAAMADEQASTCQELDHLCRSVEHIKEIVTAQQAFAKPERFLEETSLSELVDEAIRLNAQALSRHQISIERSFSECPMVKIDRHKTLQILVNLIANANNAISENNTVQKQISINIRSIQCDGLLMARVAVTDTGIGIAAENMKKLFQHGFTTRKEGHGFGLHAAANDAREMGGSLSATSGGIGAGATFILDVPAEPATVRKP